VFFNFAHPEYNNMKIRGKKINHEIVVLAFE
jgi:hypothetical protein